MGGRLGKKKLDLKAEKETYFGAFFVPNMFSRQSSIYVCERERALFNRMVNNSEKKEKNSGFRFEGMAL